MASAHRKRRVLAGLVVVIAALAVLLTQPDMYQPTAPPDTAERGNGQAVIALDTLPIKGRAPKTGYERTQFGSGWRESAGCDTRNSILHRDLHQDVVDKDCHVQSGTLDDPYTGHTIQFKRGVGTSQAVQIDHVVALSNAWQTGAQALSADRRIEFANDPLNLLAVDGPANQQKSDGDAATWLPSNKPFRCQYVARQIAVKTKYELWVTSAEKAAMSRVLGKCAATALPEP